LATSSSFPLVGGNLNATGFSQGPLSAGSYSFLAHYSGDSVYAGADGLCEPLSVTVSPASIGQDYCSAGYFKLLPKHSSAWVGYAPGSLFSSVFANAFPSKTLIQVLSLTGGGLNALGRAAVTALLNASNPSISSALNTTQVINIFNSAFAIHTNAAYSSAITQLTFTENCPLPK